MKDFEYAAPHEEADVVELLAPDWGGSEVLAGGTDLIGLMRKMIVTPERVVNIMEVGSFRGIERDSTGVTIGAVTTLDDVLASPDLDDYPSIKQAIQGIASPQLQSQGTIGGELCWPPGAAGWPTATIATTLSSAIRVRRNSSRRRGPPRRWWRWARNCGSSVPPRRMKH
jgi:CO/xanthine dehydrogenase FAD-binding subunit